MLDENEFKPFTSNDFTVNDAISENTESTSTSGVNLSNSTESSDTEVSDRISSFKPLIFEEEEISEDFIANESNIFKAEKTDAEKIQLSEEFKNSEFFLENSLLTNAEDFAETIREGAKLHKAQLLKQIEEQANDTDRIHQKTVAENQAAEKQRKKLLSDTENKVQQIKDEAYDEGFAAGRTQGVQQRYEETEPLARQANKILEQLFSLRKVVRFQAEEELVKLALQISKNIVAEEIKLNQDVIKNIVKAALHETDVQGKIYLYLHPDDYEFLLKSKTEVERYLSDEQNLVIRQNPDLELGSIIVESDEEIISRSIEEQFKLVEDNLNEQIENRQAHLNEVDIDAHDFDLPPDQVKQTAKKEPADFKNPDLTDDPLNQAQSEQEKIEKGIDETDKTNDVVFKSDTEDAFNKEDSILEDEVLKIIEDPKNTSLKEADTGSESNDRKHSEQSSSLFESKAIEGENESEIPTNQRMNIETEETKVTSSNLSEE